MNITKHDLVDMIKDKLPDIETLVIVDIVNNMIDLIIKELSEDRFVDLRNFGSFRVHQRRGRVAHNPKTLVKLTVPPKKIPTFKASLKLKKMLATYKPPQKHKFVDLLNNKKN